MKPAVLVTKRVFPEAIELLEQHAEVEYADSDDGLPPEELLRRSRGYDNVDLAAATRKGILVRCWS